MSEKCVYLDKDISRLWRGVDSVKTDKGWDYMTDEQTVATVHSCLVAEVYLSFENFWLEQQHRKEILSSTASWGWISGVECLSKAYFEVRYTDYQMILTK